MKWLALISLMGPLQVFAASSLAVGLPVSLEPVKGIDLRTSKDVTVSSAGKKGMVLVFLSAVCPCSNSHVKELSALAADYPEFSFAGVHSNDDESPVESRAYFEKVNLPFVILQDEKSALADRLKALKTPHAFVILPNGEIAFQGGVSSSRDFDRADRKHLREALADLKAGRPVKVATARPLGCSIERASHEH